MNTEDISRNRLNNEPCPKDLAFLIENCVELLSDMEVEISDKKQWEPWNDKSYLTEEDFADPDISANVKAIDDTFALISFVAEFPDSEFVGYWRGVDNSKIEDCPLVHYSNDGQFSLCGSRFIESLFVNLYEDECLEEMKNKVIEKGIEINFRSIDEIKNKYTKIEPNVYHEQKYEEHKESANN